MKFGGTSVGDVAAFERVVHVVGSQLDKMPVVVVSAMTKVTDSLLAAFDLVRAISRRRSRRSNLILTVMSLSSHFISEGSPNLFDAELQFAWQEIVDL